MTKDYILFSFKWEEMVVEGSIKKWGRTKVGFSLRSREWKFIIKFSSFFVFMARWWPSKTFCLTPFFASFLAAAAAVVVIDAQVVVADVVVVFVVVDATAEVVDAVIDVVIETVFANDVIFVSAAVAVVIADTASTAVKCC